MDQTAIVYIALGFLVGFGAEWAYDFFVARRRRVPLPLPEHTEALESAKAESANLAKQVTALEPLRGLIEMKQKELEEMKLDVARATANETELKARISHMQSHIDSSGEGGQYTEPVSTSHFTEQIERLEQALETKDNELSELSHRLREAASNPGSASVAQLNQLAEQYEQTMATMKCELMEQEQIIIDLEGKLSEFEGGGEVRVSKPADPMYSFDEHQTIQVMDSLRATVLSRDAEILELKRELEDTQSQIMSAEEQKVLKSLNEALQRDVESLRVVSTAKDLAVSESQAALAQLEAQLAFQGKNQQEPSEDLAALQADLQAKTEELDSLNQTVVELRESAQAYPAENEALKSELDKNREAMDDLVAKVSEMEQAMRSHPEAIATLKAEIDQNEQKFIELTANLTEFQGIADARHAELSQLKAELESKEEEHQAAMSRLAEQEEVMRTHPVEMERLMAELAEKDRAMAELEARAADTDKIQALEQELQKRDQAIEAMHSKVGLLLNSLGDIGALATPPSPPAEATTSPEPERETPVLSVAPPAQPMRFEGSSRKDSFIQISGIGHLFERKLWEAGITTFESLANLSTDEVYEIIQPAEWQRIEPDRWIAEAARRSLNTGT